MNPRDLLPPRAILEFFAHHGRDLPWRHPAIGAWPILVSEVMLQQTPVARVLPVFEHWLRTWPTPGHLAADAPGDAVRAWGRLGYPRRALRLHACATAIITDHGGVVPEEVDVLLTLPGVGDYTARAVAAFAYGAAAPVVDTNVRRVINRAIRGNNDAGPATAADRSLMQTLLPDQQAATFSAAVMELGALICTRAAPECGRCPLRESCRWLAAGQPSSEVRNKKQAWNGTDRQVRGRILALLRDAPEPLSEAEVRLAWPDAEQWQRCVNSLLADKLIARADGQALMLPS
ncbi:A/G-specific adenine glycosylase [Nakamurella antarctica]|uniref:A/G-specific adenine glycosylase n=1 Tax=Nakamurella antarctica TaxID=1902245 RepID=UPI001EF0FD34|nr:A/G-specific adenine glycosylase [Nakamurella antarctica]